jgi:hypothetical protein
MSLLSVPLCLYTAASVFALYLAQKFLQIRIYEVDWTQAGDTIVKVRPSVSVVLHLLFSRYRKWKSIQAGGFVH